MILRMLFVTLCLLIGVAHADSAPSFRLPSQVGKQTGTITLDQLRGKVVYVDFWASWCTPCRKSFPWLNQMSERYAKNGLVVVGINLDKERGLATDFLKETPAKFTVAFDPDGNTADAYQVKVMPSSFLIDKSGHFINKHRGFRDQDVAELEKKIKAAVDAR